MDLPLPLIVNSLEQWKDFVCQSVDIFYGCDAVRSFKSWGSYWQVILNPGIDARQIRPYLKALMRKIESALAKSGYRPPEILYLDSNVGVTGKKYTGRSKFLQHSKAEWLWKPKQPDIKYDIKFVVGEKIVVISGPFRDFEGEVIDICHERSKIKALLSIFGRDTPVELDLSQFKKL